MMHFFRNNMMAKLLSFLGAVMLWVYVMNEQNPILEASYTATVEKVADESNFMIENVPNTIRVTFKGPRNTILALRQQDIKATINLNNLKVGEQDVPINVVTPRGLTLVTQQPLTATIVADLYAAKSVPLTVRRLGTLADVHGVIETKAEPEMVIVSGAKRHVDKVVHGLATIKLDNKRTTFSEDVDVIPLDASDKMVKDVNISPQTASVQVKIELVDVIKNITVTPRIEGKPAEGYRVGKVEVTPVQVQVGGATEALASITSLSTMPIDVSGATQDIVREVQLVEVDKVYGANRDVTVTVKIEKLPPGESNATNR